MTSLGVKKTVPQLGGSTSSKLSKLTPQMAFFVFWEGSRVIQCFHVCSWTKTIVSRTCLGQPVRGRKMKGAEPSDLSHTTSADNKLSPARVAETCRPSNEINDYCYTSLRFCKGSMGQLPRIIVAIAD